MLDGFAGTGASVGRESRRRARWQANEEMTTEQDQPRFNPWPYSILGFFIVAIIGAVVWVGFCLGHNSDLVAHDYYEQEVEYQGQLDRMERADGLSGRASIALDAEAAVIRVRLPVEHVAGGAQGGIHLYRPSEARLDQMVGLALNSAGEQQLDAATLAPGLWEVRVAWSAGGEEYFLSRKIRIDRGPS